MALYFSPARTVANDPHPLRCLAASAAPRADVIGRSQAERPSVPEGRTVARMIIGISAQDVEGQPPEQLTKRSFRLRETMADGIREQVVSGIGCHHLVELEQGRRRDRVPPTPTAVGALAVEPLNEQDVLSERMIGATSTGFRSRRRLGKGC